MLARDVRIYFQTASSLVFIDHNDDYPIYI